MATLEFESYLASVDLTLLASSLHESWWWLESIRELRAVALTLAGDVFLVDRSNAVFFLDTNFGVLERVAANNDALRVRLQHEAFTRSILRTDLILELRSRGVLTKHNQCYMLALTPLFGGAMSADRARPGSFEVLLSFLGQLNQQTKDMPVGQEMYVAFPDWPGGSAAPEHKRPLRKHARDRPSFGELDAGVY